MEDDSVHGVPKGGVALAPDEDAAEARGGRPLEVDALPRHLAQRSEAADAPPRTARARRALERRARRRERVDLAEQRERRQLPLLAQVED